MFVDLGTLCCYRITAVRVAVAMRRDLARARRPAAGWPRLNQYQPSAHHGAASRPKDVYASSQYRMVHAAQLLLLAALHWLPCAAPTAGGATIASVTPFSGGTYDKKAYNAGSLFAANETLAFEHTLSSPGPGRAGMMTFLYTLGGKDASGRYLGDNTSTQSMLPADAPPALCLSVCPPWLISRVWRQSCAITSTARLPLASSSNLVRLPFTILPNRSVQVRLLLRSICCAAWSDGRYVQAPRRAPSYTWRRPSITHTLGTKLSAGRPVS